MFDYDLKYTMPNSYIPPIDLGSMKASLEVRSPFLNKNLYEYILKNIDKRSLLKLGSKNILKTILKDLLKTWAIKFWKKIRIYTLGMYLQKKLKNLLLRKHQKKIHLKF